MKKLFLLAILLVSVSVRSQTDPLNQSRLDSLRNQRIQDSIRDKALLDILNPSGSVEPEVPKPVIVQDTTRPAAAKDTVKTISLPPDTAKPAIPVEIPVQKPDSSTITAPPTPTTAPVVQDTAKKLVAPADSLKPKPQVIDSLKQKENEAPKPILDSLKNNGNVSPPDTLKPNTSTVEVPVILRPDSIIRRTPPDSLSPDELQRYYVLEPEPIDFYKGPDIGDSVFYLLNPWTIPTFTNGGYALGGHGDGILAAEELSSDSAFNAEQRLKPKISLGMGRMGFNGDLYQRHFQVPTMGRPAFDLAISQRLTRYLQVDFNVLFGKLGGNERLNNRNENFSSEIRAGGINLLYDFGNLIPDAYKVRPFVSFGAYGFEFLSKTDLKDKNGNTYYYWSDGSIKDRAEGSPGAQNAQDLVRDYTYESDIRELNKDGFGKYQERAWAFPVGAGVVMKVTDRIDLKLNFQYYFSTTDYIDGISNKSIGDRSGTKRKDNFTYTSFSLQYDLISKRKPRSARFRDTLSNDSWLAIDTEDTDQDGVPDMSDACQGTPVGAKVDERGCPLDGDNDGIPDYRDDELTTAAGVPVNARGVGQTDEYWAAWYAQYLNDTLATDRTTEYTGNIYATVTKKPKEKKENFTVELVRYTGSIPSDELAFLLSIGDINTMTLDDGTTVVYTSGTYDKLSTAIKRRDEFRTTGSKGAGISRIQGKEIVQVPETELEKLLASEIADLMNLNVGGDTTTTSGTVGSVLPEEVGQFTKEDVVYRVQLGAFRNKISTKVFNTSAGVLELKTGENVYRYVTKGYKTIEDAAAVRADLVVQGYSDAFVTAYQGGKRIPMSQTKATMDKGYKEDMSETKTFNSIDKKLLVFKVQLGPLKKASQEVAMDEKVKDLSNIEKQTTASGSIRYTAGGDFSRLDAAEKLRKDLEDKGYTDAFIIATFKNEIISIQEAMELLK